MFWTMLALLLMAVIGGFISYFGDLQGRRWGKKRVSLFGLRPKHTAILLTSITGGVISLLSVGAMMLIVPQVREIVLRGEDAIRQNKIDRKNMEAQNTRFANQLEVQKLQKLASERERVELSEKVEGGKGELVELKGKIAASYTRYMSLEREKLRLQSESRLLMTENRKLFTENKTISKEIVNAGFINAGLVTNNTTISRQILALEKRGKELQLKIASLEASSEKLVIQNEELSKTRDQLLAKTDLLAKHNITLQDSYTQLVDENTQQAKKVQVQIADLKKELDNLTTQRNLINSDRQELVQNYLQQLHGRYILLAEGELARTTIEAHTRPESVRTQLRELLNQASAKAHRYGAGQAENGRYVYIPSKKVVTASNIESVDENATLEAIVENITGSDVPVVVVAQIVSNSKTDEPVQVDLRSFASRTVFKKGELIASKVIDSRGDLEQVITDLSLFLKEDVRKAAVKSGAIPLINPDTGEVVVGTLGPAPILALADKIKRTGGQVQLNAVASAVITSADQLAAGATSVNPNMRFDVKRISQPSNR